MIPVVLCIAYGLLIGGWIGGNPPYAAPDEWSHYLRALGIGQGRLIGDPYQYPVPAGSTMLERRSWTWINQAARTVPVAGGRFAPGLDCNAGQPEVSAACLYARAPIEEATMQPTPVGNYQPLPYALPGLLARLGGDPFAADLLGRAAAGLTCWAFLALACWLVWDGRAASLVGLLATVTPMVLFIAASLTPSGLEICAGIAFAAALLRLWRDERARAWVWLAAGLSGAALALSRSTGPIYVGLDLLAFVALLGAGGVLGRARRAPLGAALGGAILGVGVVLSRWWERAYGAHLPIDPPAVAGQFGAALARLPHVLHEEVGVFGSLDIGMPLPAVALWAALLLALGGLALGFATWRERLVLLGATGGVLGVTVGISALFVAGTGFDVQGRHILPLAALVPLLAAEIVSRHRARLSPRLARRGVAALALLVALGHLVGWYTNARRHAVGESGPLWFLGDPAWLPVAGWWPWLAVALAGGLCLIWLAAASARQRGTPPRAA